MTKIRTESRLPWKPLLALAVVATAVVLIVRNKDEVEAFSEGVTGNQALQQMHQIDDQLGTIQDERQRQLDEVMGY